MNSEKVLEDKSGPMAVDMRVTGLTIRQTVSENFSMLMVMCTRENGKTTRLMARELTLTLTGLDIKEIGEMTSNTDSVLRPGLTVPFMKDNILRAKRTARAN